MNRSSAGKLAAARRGQTMVMVALMVTVLFGFLALAVDVGYGWAQRRFMQNAADAGSLAAARLLASSVAQDDLGIYFVTTDGTVRRQAIDYAQQNRVADSNGAPGDATNANVTMSYLDLAGNLLATSPTADNTVPRVTAQVRVQTRITFDTFFARVVDVNSLAAAASAAASIRGASKPTSMSNVWPFAVRRQDYDPTEPFPIWEPSHYGDFKGSVYLGPCTLAPEQCVGIGPTALDPYYPGTGTGRQDVPVWVRNGFRGTITADETAGDKVETFGGDYANEVSQAMKDYINLNALYDENGKYAYAYVMLWDYGLQWNSGQNQYVEWRGNGSPDVVQIVEIMKIKIYYFDQPNRAEAYYVSFEVPPVPGGSPPSVEANYVGLSE